MTVTKADLVGQLLAEAVRNRQREHGVIVRDIAHIEAEPVLRHLAALDAEGVDLRVAYVLPGGSQAIEALQLPSDRFSAAVEQAEAWRNTAGLESTIVVVASGDEPRLSSLQDFDAVGPGQLKRLLVRRAQGGLASENEVQSRWWRLLENDAAISLGQLIDYYASLASLELSEVVRQSSRELHRLGLLPDPSLFDSPKESAVKRRLDDNRDLVRRLQMLTEKDRRVIASNIAEESDPSRIKELTASQRALREMRRGTSGLDALTYSGGQALLGIRRSSGSGGGSGGGSDRPERTSSSGLAARELLGSADDGSLDEVVSEFDEQLNNLEEVRLRPEKIAVDLRSGGRVEGEARADVINLAASLLNEGVFGAWIDPAGDGIDERIRRFHGHQDVKAWWHYDEISDFLKNFEDAAVVELRDKFEKFNDARNRVLPLLRLLCVDPLLAASSATYASLLAEYVDAYEVLIGHLNSSYPALLQEYGPDADAILGHFLLLDVIVIGAGQETFAITAPTHALYLWHFVEFAKTVQDQRALLSAADRALVEQVAEEIPNFLDSVVVPAVTADEVRVLPFVGRLGPLPFFGPRPDRSTSDDGIGAVLRFVNAYLDVSPPARRGLRMTLIDPPDAGAYLLAMDDLAASGSLEGAHLTVLRSRNGRHGMDLRLTPDEEELVARRFASAGLDRRFTFDIRPVAEPVAELPPDLTEHLIVAFDQTPGRRDRALPVAHPMQPLAMKRRLIYRAAAQTVELVPAPGGIFAAYYEVGQRLGKSPPASYFSVHQAEEVRARLDAISSAAEWFALADRHVDRDLSLGSLRLLTDREGHRDVAAFANAADPFRHALREVARQYNTAIRNEQLDDLLDELSNLLDVGVITVRHDFEGKVNHAHIKGLLGTLIAARWYKTHSPAGRRRLLLSLDDPVARRWLHLREDPERADLIGLEIGTEDDFCSLTIFEVKSVQDLGTEVKIQDGVASGPAVNQLLSTRRLLNEVFAADRTRELITTPARREILRESAFRELAKPSHDPADRRAWVDALERIFDGEVIPSIHCQLVDVQLGVDSSSLMSNRQRVARAEDQDDSSVPIAIVQLNEEAIDALSQAVGDEPPEEEPPPDGESGTPSAPGPGGAAGPAYATDSLEEPDGQIDEDEGTQDWDDSRLPTVEAPVSPADGRPRSFIGEAPGTYGRPREVWFDPELEDQPLPNPHICITGETGSGKTQAIKAILRDLRQDADLPVLILDFKDDYSQLEYVGTELLDVFDASFGGLPFNPMVPPVDPRSGKASPINHIHQLSDIFKRIYHLGDQQAFQLREAMKATYEIQGVGTRPFTPQDDQTFLPFDAVRDVLDRESNKTLLGRLSPIFDLGLFSQSDEESSLAEVLGGGSVVRLSQLPGDEVKNAVAEFLLMALYNHLIKQPQPRALRRVLVLDEAWRLVNSPFMEPLMREGRAFGLGVVVATQFFGDLPGTVTGSSGTKMFFSQTRSDQLRDIQRTLVGKTGGAEADHLAAVLQGLPPLTCLFQNGQYTPYVRTEVRPYFARIPES